MDDNNYQSPDPEQNEPKDEDEEWKGFYNFHPGYDPSKPPKKDSGGLIVGLICAAVFLGLTALAVLGITRLGGKDLSGQGGQSSDVTSSVSSAPSEPTSSQATPAPTYKPEDLPLDLEDVESSTDDQDGVIVAKKVCPSIVGVLKYEKFQDGYQIKGSGSGIILSEDGFIVTNQHVIEGAAKVAVTLYSEDGMNESDSFVAQVVGQDATTDIALLKIETTGLTPASFADSDQLQPGERVYAIGNPGGLDFYASISEGLVSGLNRPLDDLTFIQTDVAINPGSSGGALVNVYGQVVGITSEKIVTVSDVSAEGLSFAIPTSVAMPILRDLLENGYVLGRVSLRITVDAYSDAHASIEGWPEGCRLCVNSVASGSNAEKAGVRKGLFIIKVGGVPVKTMKELRAERDKVAAGQTITLTLYDHKTKKTTDVSFILEEDRGL